MACEVPTLDCDVNRDRVEKLGGRGGESSQLSSSAKMLTKSTPPSSFALKKIQNHIVAPINVAIF